jgi:antitoxin PrlF
MADWVGNLVAKARRCIPITVKVRFLHRIPTFVGPTMQVTEKGQVTIPKHIRVAAGVVPGSEVSFSLEGSKIVMTPVGTGAKADRREKLRAAAARVRASLSPEFKQLGADEIMTFLRGDEAAPAPASHGRR